MGWFVGHRPTIVTVPERAVSPVPKAIVAAIGLPTVLLGSRPICGNKMIKNAAGSSMNKQTLTALLRLLPPWQEALSRKLLDTIEAVPLVFRPLLPCVRILLFGF